MGSVSFRRWLRARGSWGLFGSALLAASAVLAGTAVGACGAIQVPPGPEPEYQRPEVAPWKAGVASADPLAGIEADGEWVDDGSGEGGAPGSPAPDPLSPPPPKF